MEKAKEPVENVIALWIAECKGYADFSAWEVQGACELLDRLDAAGFEVWSKSVSQGELDEIAEADRMADELERLTKEAS